MPPEALTFGKLSNKADVWTLGVILLLCISIEFDFDAFTCKSYKIVLFILILANKNSMQQIIKAL